MKLTVVRDVYGSRFDIETAHQKEELTWSGKTYDKTELFKDNWDSLRYINAYWASLPYNSQDEIFELYKKIRDIFNSNSDVSSMMKNLYPIIKTLLDDYHDLDEILEWMKTKSDIIVPPNIQESMEYEAGSNVTSEKTYLRKNYLELIAFAIACEAMIPVWCEYIRYAGPAVGSDFKEWQALRLMSQAKIWRCDAINMLMRYISLHSTDVGDDEAIMKGICREDLPRFNATPVIIRRVAIGDLSGHNANQYFINFIYSYIKQLNNNPKGLGRNQPASRIKPKRDTSGERGDVDELSTLEGYKSQPKVCIGDSESLRFFTDDPRSIAKAIDPTIPKNKIKMCLESIRALELMPLDRSQKVLTQWFCVPAIPSRGIEELTKSQLLNLMAVCQAALWHWGHLHVAVLITAMPDDDYQQASLMLSDSFDLSSQYREAMNFLFPFDKGGKRANAKKVSNAGIDCIENLTAMLHTREWLAFAPQQLKEEHAPPIHKSIPIAPHIRDMLAAAFIDSIYKRSNADAS